ncbi:MAG TPA: hypothetical protein VG295_09900, partial [Solirubrobacteraceae bacterium]|nr:hypothetical protein [Solirubrobacteraceae bacterium]
MSRQERQHHDAAGFDVRAVAQGAAAVVGAVVAVYLIGLVVTWVSFAAARLPGDTVTAALSDRQLFGAGLRSTA